jgi:hypothetical protein
MLETFGHKKAPAGAEAPIPNLTSNKRFHSSRKLPPFGRDLFYRLSQGQRPQNVVWVACGLKAWDRAKHDLKRSDSSALCLPFGDDPSAYHWPVTGLSCIVVHTGGCEGATLKALGTELIQAGADSAVILGADGELGASGIYFKPQRVES